MRVSQQGPSRGPGLRAGRLQRGSPAQATLHPSDRVVPFAEHGLLRLGPASSSISAGLRVAVDLPVSMSFVAGRRVPSLLGAGFA